MRIDDSKYDTLNLYEDTDGFVVYIPHRIRQAIYVNRGEFFSLVNDYLLCEVIYTSTQKSEVVAQIAELLKCTKTEAKILAIAYGEVVLR